jgi:hypothetical protein
MVQSLKSMNFRKSCLILIAVLILLSLSQGDDSRTGERIGEFITDAPVQKERLEIRLLLNDDGSIQFKTDSLVGIEGTKEDITKLIRVTLFKDEDIQDINVFDMSSGNEESIPEVVIREGCTDGYEFDWLTNELWVCKKIHTEKSLRFKITGTIPSKECPCVKYGVCRTLNLTFNGSANTLLTIKELYADNLVFAGGEGGLGWSRYTEHETGLQGQIFTKSFPMIEGDVATVDIYMVGILEEAKEASEKFNVLLGMLFIYALVLTLISHLYKSRRRGTEVKEQHIHLLLVVSLAALSFSLPLLYSQAAGIDPSNFVVYIWYPKLILGILLLVLPILAWVIAVFDIELLCKTCEGSGKVRCNNCFEGYLSPYKAGCSFVVQGVGKDKDGNYIVKVLISSITNGGYPGKGTLFVDVYDSTQTRKYLASRSVGVHLKKGGGSEEAINKIVSVKLGKLEGLIEKLGREPTEDNFSVNTRFEPDLESSKKCDKCSGSGFTPCPVCKGLRLNLKIGT